MAPFSTPHSLSLYRGQSRHGIGEGPGRPIVAGEQYLEAEAPLDTQGELLVALQPWMSLDAEPADARATADALEAWSCLELGGYSWVIRLCLAPFFDRRLAYFSHGRAWKLAASMEGPEPAALLSQSHAFEPPFRDGASPSHNCDPRAEPQPRLPLPAAEPELASRWLATLYTGLSAGRPVVVAVPITELVAGGRVSSLACFALNALPRSLRRLCRTRIFTRQPATFLRHGATFLVVPEEVAATALAAARGCLLINLMGEPQLRFVVRPEVSAYSEIVTQLAGESPESAFSLVSRWAPREGLLPNRPQLVSLSVARWTEHGRMASAEVRVAALDRSMRQSPQDTAAALAESGWWWWWRLQSGLAPSSWRSAAWDWLTAPCWGAQSGAEATLETWNQVLEDLRPEGLSRDEIAALWRDHQRRWPLVPPFETRQLRDLAGLARDLAAEEQLHFQAAADPEVALLWNALGEPGPSFLPRLAEKRAAARALARSSAVVVSATPSAPAFELLPSLAPLLAPANRDPTGWLRLLKDLEASHGETGREGGPDGSVADRISVALALLWRCRRVLEPVAAFDLAQALARYRHLVPELQTFTASKGALPMYERVTLFFPRDGRAVEPQRCEVLLQGVAAQVLVWRRQRPKTVPLRALLRRQQESAARTFDELCQEVERSGGGLVVAGQPDASGGFDLRLRSFAATVNDAASTLWRLSPGALPEVLGLSSGELSVARGQHLVIPVDREAEHQLAQLRESLGFFPSEVAALLLETLIQPSLDYRLSLVEERIYDQPARPPQRGVGTARSFGERFRAFLARPLPIGRLAATLALALALAYGAAALAPPLAEYLTASERRAEALEAALTRLEQKLGTEPPESSILPRPETQPSSPTPTVEPPKPDPPKPRKTQTKTNPRTPPADGKGSGT